MSLATIDTYRPTTRPTTAPTLAPEPPAASVVAPAIASAPSKLRAVPDGTEARGFALYIGIDEQTALEAGTDLGAVVTALKELAAELVPGAGSYAAVALAPVGAGGRDVDVVRLALQEPGRPRQASPGHRGRAAGAEGRRRDRHLPQARAARRRHRAAHLQGVRAAAVPRAARGPHHRPRAEIISTLWADGADDEIPNERTIDVHVRRLRSKLGAYEDIVRTVRGVGYRFDRHADVAIRWASTPSPDIF